MPEAKLPESVLASSVRALYADPAAAAAQAVDKIAAARVWLLKEKPFFGVLARALQVEPTLAVAAFRLTADDRLLANALVTLELKFPSLCARLAHVALHAALGALVRRGAREALRWNAAHDLAIAPLLQAAGFGMGPSPAIEELPRGASAEQYYALLPEGTKPDDLWCDLAEPPPPPGSPPPAGHFTRQDDGLGDEPGAAPKDGAASPDGQAGDGDGSPDAPDGGEPPGGEDTSPVDARGRELQWKMRLGAALEEERASGGKTFGEIPGWIDDWVRATIEPPPDWSATLQLSVAMLSRTDRTFLRPSRRMAALAGPDGSWPDVVTMPGHKVIPAGRLVSVIDTSASIDAATLAHFLGALAAAATAEGFDELRVLQSDAEVTQDEVLLAAELLFQEIPIVGRGGTHFGPALHKLAEESRRTGERFTVIYLTDLEGRFPNAEEVRPLDVLWVVPGQAKKVPPFGKLVEMKGAANADPRPPR